MDLKQLAEGNFPGVPANLDVFKDVKGPDIESLRFPSYRPATEEMLKRIQGIPGRPDGEAIFDALQAAVREGVSSAPTDHDVLIEAFGIRVSSIEYVAPHALIFRGLTGGNTASVIAHFTQVVAYVIYLPKAGPERVITGFSRTRPDAS